MRIRINSDRISKNTILVFIISRPIKINLEILNFSTRTCRTAQIIILINRGVIDGHFAGIELVYRAFCSFCAICGSPAPIGQFKDFFLVVSEIFVRLPDNFIPTVPFVDYIWRFWNLSGKFDNSCFLSQRGGVRNICLPVS